MFPIDPYKIFPEYDKVLEGIKTYQTMDLEEFAKFEELYFEYKMRHDRIIAHRWPSITLWPKLSRDIQQYGKQLLINSDPCANRYYHPDNGVEMSPDEVVNGYNLFQCDKTVTPMSYMVFKSFWEDWNTEDISEAEFAKLFDSDACSDWSKIDRNGTSYGGFWKYPKDSEEYTTAYFLTREDNFRGLCELPYPRRVMLQTIDIGCQNRMESVRYTNSLCEWVKRKAAIVYANQVPTLATLARAALPENTEIPEYLNE